MCEVTTLLTIASTALGYIGQQQQAKAQQNAINQQYATQQEQINQKAAQDMSQTAREAMLERGRLRVAQAESGLAGVSQDRHQNALDFKLGTDLSTLEYNRQNSISQSQAEQAAASSRVDHPSLFGTGLQIASAGYSGYKTWTGAGKPSIAKQIGF